MVHLIGKYLVTQKSVNLVVKCVTELVGNLLLLNGIVRIVRNEISTVAPFL
jgi:hypothetical protein